MKHFSLLVAACLLLLACTVGLPRQAMTCDEIASNALRALNFEGLNPETMLQWIETNYGVDESAMARLDAVGYPNHLSLAWEPQGNSYKYLIDFDENRLIAFHVWWQRRRAPTADEVISCLGVPELYRATYLAGSHQNILTLELWYLEQGIVVRHVNAERPGRNQPPPLDENILGSSMTVVQPGSVEEIAEKEVIPISGNHSLSVYPLKPWPGTWENIEVEVDPELLR